MKRIFACLFILAVLPLMSSSTRHASSYVGPFATVAFAGHTTQSGFFCNCEPGAEVICSCCGASLSKRALADEVDEHSLVQEPSITSTPDSKPDDGAAALLLLVVFLAWSRM